ncbi:MAG: hypothetical protein RJQ04_20345 [Longimicrobiales bacterium]
MLPCLALLAALQGPGLHTRAPDALRSDPVDAVVAAFAESGVRLVALGENHGHLEFHDLLLAILADPRAAERIDDVAVEWGNARYQDIVDRWVAGLDAPWDSVQMAWRNSVVSPNTVWDAPVYARFFQRIRDLNAGLPPEHRYRVVLADGGVEWSAVRERDDLSPYLDRARTMAETIRQASLLRGRTTLFVAGGLHVAKRNRVRVDARGLPRAEITPIGWIELHHPGVSRSIQSMARPEALGVPELEGSGPPSVRSADAPDLASIPANRTTTLRDRDGGRPDIYGTATLADVVDAVIVWDSTRRTFPEPDPSIYADDAWWAELNRRSEVVRGRPMDPAIRDPAR